MLLVKKSTTGDDPIGDIRRGKGSTGKMRRDEVYLGWWWGGGSTLVYAKISYLSTRRRHSSVQKSGYQTTNQPSQCKTAIQLSLSQNGKHALLFNLLLSCFNVFPTNLTAWLGPINLRNQSRLLVKDFLLLHYPTCSWRRTDGNAKT